jgi:hypothetical protein
MCLAACDSLTHDDLSLLQSWPQMRQLYGKNWAQLKPAERVLQWTADDEFEWADDGKVVVDMRDGRATVSIDSAARQEREREEQRKTRGNYNLVGQKGVVGADSVEVGWLRPRAKGPYETALRTEESAHILTFLQALSCRFPPRASNIWAPISQSRCYMPNSSDIGRALRFEVAPLLPDPQNPYAEPSLGQWEVIEVLMRECSRLHARSGC